jgi:hypothetical protein
LFLLFSAAMHVSAWAAFTQRAVPRHDRSFDTTPQTLVGDTLDIDPAPPDESPAGDAPQEQTPPSSPEPQAPAAIRNETGSHPARIADRASSTPEGSAPAAPPALFGAVGVRYATDLPTTFTRMFPNAASGDPAWNDAPLGSAGAAEVTLVLDDAGQLVSDSVAGSPPRALRAGIDRTLAALRGRTFTAHAAVTRLRITARVQRDEVHDGLHGDRFALGSGGSFASDVGSAFFALPGPGAGRRIDVELRIVR